MTTYRQAEAILKASACRKCHGEGTLYGRKTWIENGQEIRESLDRECPDCRGTGFRMIQGQAEPFSDRYAMIPLPDIQLDPDERA